MMTVKTLVHYMMTRLTDWRHPPAGGNVNQSRIHTLLLPWAGTIKAKTIRHPPTESHSWDKRVWNVRYQLKRENTLCT